MVVKAMRDHKQKIVFCGVLQMIDVVLDRKSSKAQSTFYSKYPNKCSLGESVLNDGNQVTKFCVVLQVKAAVPKCEDIEFT